MSVAAPNNASTKPRMSGKFTASPKLMSEIGVVGRVRDAFGDVAGDVGSSRRTRSDSRQDATTVHRRGTCSDTILCVGPGGQRAFR